MFTLTMNGKPFDPDDFEKAVMEAALLKVKEHLHEQLSSIRNPQTGEFPTVQVMGCSLEDMSARVEGSAELLHQVRQSLGPEGLARVDLVEKQFSKYPKAFLSFGWEDRALAKVIAEALQKNGIDTWWADWELRAGDSLRQKIDEGLNNCNIFLVLLTPESIKKPWVHQEMDAGLIRKIEMQARFIAIRKGLALSPALENLEADIKQLVADLHGVSRKPHSAFHPLRLIAKRIPDSPARLLQSRACSLKQPKMQRCWDPQISIHQIAEETSLSAEDVSDALFELKEMVDQHDDSVVAKPELYTTFDRHFNDWDPASDALARAADFLNDSSFPREPDQIAVRCGWLPRRLNPALSYLISRKLVQSSTHMGMGPWIAVHVEKTDAMRRFVKSRH